jgi:hypothetical protein
VLGSVLIGGREGARNGAGRQRGAVLPDDADLGQHLANRSRGRVLLDQIREDVRMVVEHLLVGVAEACLSADFDQLVVLVIR